jgi:hypothetical protein
MCLVVKINGTVGVSYYALFIGNTLKIINSELVK